MQKHWKVFMALLLALMMLMSSVAIAEGGVAAPSEPMATQEPEGTDTPEVTPEATLVPPAATETAENPEVESGEEQTPGEEGEVSLETSIEIDPEAAASADAPVATEVPPARPLGRETWVILNIGMKELVNDRAVASNMMAKFLLARAVADNAPVGVFMMREKNAEIFRGSVVTPAEWDELMDRLAEVRFDAEANVTQLLAFAEGIQTNKTDMTGVDMRMLSTDNVTESGFARYKAIRDLVNAPDMSLHFYRFMEKGQTLEKKQTWLDDRIRALDGVAEFVTEEFIYREAVQNPIATAMDVFELNLLAPQTPIVRNEEGAVIWAHKGMDTLLVLGTDATGVTVTAQNDVHGVGAFPIVIPMGDEQCMVLLRDVAPGTYRIDGPVNSLTAAYQMDLEEVKPVVQDLQAESEPWTWYLEERVLRVSMNLPQVRDVDPGKVMYIGQVQEMVEELSWVPEEETEAAEDAADETAEPVEEETAAPTDHLQKVVLTDEHINLVSSNEDGHVWEIRVPRQTLGKGEICFAFNVGDFVVTSDIHQFEVVDRPLALADAGVAPLTCFYNVPGQADAPVQADLAPYFANPDQQTLIYTPLSHMYTIENDIFQYHRGDNVEEKVWYLQVSDGVSAPVDFTVNMKLVDFAEAVAKWQADIERVEYEGQLGVDTEIAFTLPKECTAFYQAVRAQYSELPQNLTEALKLTAVLTDSRYPGGELLPVELTENEDGSLTGKVFVPKYSAQESGATVTFVAEILGESIADQRIVPACSISVPNDKPAVANMELAELSIKAGIHGAPDAREPLTFAAINAGQKEGAVLLPEPFVPEQLFADKIHLEGLTVTIQADQPTLVQLIPADGDAAAAIQSVEGVWELAPEDSGKPYILQILDEGDVTLTISAHDGEHASTGVITWTFKVHSVYDLILLLIIITASVLAVLIIVLLVMRQIRKPSFARMNSVMNMRMCTLYSPNGPFVRAPMSVYGKKETDLARLFIACQQAPAMSMPMDVLADVAIQPCKRRNYRIVLGKRAEHLNIVVADVAQNTNKPVTFGQDQTVNIYADMNEVLFFQINSGR